MTDTIIEQLFVYERDARRLELLARIFFWIAIGIVAWIYSILATMCLVLQWFHILILGRRQQGLSDFVEGYLEYTVHRLSYIYFMTDRRPKILPDSVRIFEQVE
ncbi:MAG TPA: DUF4389 domain-containing protein [Methanoregulaceae archaeon]|nr:DUF4389 domain-containing protein [Methanoregulaceae archaeon]